MKYLYSLLFLLATTLSSKAQTVVFQPDLSSGIVNNGIAYDGQAGNPSSITVNSNNGLHFDASSNVGVVSNSLDTAHTHDCLLVSFNFQLDSCEAGSSKAINFQLGQDLTNTGSLNITDEYASFSIRTFKDKTTIGARDLADSTNSSMTAVDADTAITVWWVVNNGSTATTYIGPDDSNYTVAPDSWDLWINHTEAFSGSNSLNNAANAINSFKIASDFGSQHFDIDSLKIIDIPDMSALPINPLNLTATLISGGIQLNWEGNGVKYEIKRSENGKHFYSIGTKEDADSKVLNKPEDFSFVDDYPTSGAHYYQIVQTNASDKLSYSNIVVVFVKGNKLVKAAPNPTRGFVTVTGAYGNIALYTIGGKCLLQRKVRSGVCQLDLRSLPAGIYCLKVGNSVKRIIKR